MILAICAYMPELHSRKYKYILGSISESLKYIKDKML